MYLRPALLAALCLASPLAQSADAAAGEKLFATTCVACHGAKAEGNSALQAPALAGQQADYLQRQLTQFRQQQAAKKTAKKETQQAAQKQAESPAAAPETALSQ